MPIVSSKLGGIYIQKSVTEAKHQMEKIFLFVRKVRTQMRVQGLYRLPTIRIEACSDLGANNR